MREPSPLIAFSPPSLPLSSSLVLSLSLFLPLSATLPLTSLPPSSPAEFIASCGTYANLVRQAKSRQKILDKMEADGLIEMPFEEPLFRFKFADAGSLSPPLISFSEVAFSYSGNKEDYLFKDVSFGIHPASRLALVGPNGAGKCAFPRLSSLAPRGFSRKSPRFVDLPPY